jgi:histidinol dehydrogenase
MTSVEQIVRDVAERGDAALWEWALRLDDAEPARAEPGDGLPTESLLALADSVRRWHQLQRPPDVSLEIAPGVELERHWVPLRSVGIYVRAASCRRSSCAPCRRRSPASSGLS